MNFILALPFFSLLLAPLGLLIFLIIVIISENKKAKEQEEKQRLSREGLESIQINLGDIEKD